MTEQTQEEKPIDDITRASLIVSQLKAENDRKEKLIEEEKKLQSQAILSGRSQASAPQSPKTPEEIKKEGAIEFFKGSQIEKALIKHG
jgi:hypothetical protein